MLIAKIALVLIKELSCLSDHCQYNEIQFVKRCILQYCHAVRFLMECERLEMDEPTINLMILLHNLCPGAQVQGMNIIYLHLFFQYPKHMIITAVTGFISIQLYKTNLVCVFLES